MNDHPDIYAVVNERSSGYYQTFEIRSMAAVRHLFTLPVDFTLNWLFCSTSGVHGSYLSIDSLERHWDDPEEIEPPHTITVLIVQPRTCRLYFGTIEVERADLPWLRETVGRTLQGVIASQLENLPRHVYVKTEP